jgi:hypothetical protein
MIEKKQDTVSSMAGMHEAQCKTDPSDLQVLKRSV